MRTDLILGDCLEVMPTLESGSIDLILCDPPYGTTECEWDEVIPLEPMWEQLKRLIKPNGVIVMTSSQPFTTRLISSNMKMFKYCWVWKKSLKVGFQNANRRPMKNHEDVVVFGGPVYNPQGLTPYGKPCRRGQNAGDFSNGVHTHDYIQKFTNYPCSVLEIASESNTIHPTQKPIALMEYMIKTYSNEGDMVLDFAVGSGTTSIAARNTNRNSIGIESSRYYHQIAKLRLEGVYDKAC